MAVPIPYLSIILIQIIHQDNFFTTPPWAGLSRAPWSVIGLGPVMGPWAIWAEPSWTFLGSDGPGLMMGPPGLSWARL